LKAAREICYKGQSQLWSMIPAMELMVRSYEAGHEDMFFFATAPDFQPVANGAPLQRIEEPLSSIMVSQMRIFAAQIDKKLTDFTGAERTIEYLDEDGETIQHVLVADKWDSVKVMQYIAIHNSDVTYEDKTEIVMKLHGAAGAFLIGSPLAAIESILKVLTEAEDLHLSKDIHYDPTLKKWVQNILKRHSGFTELANTYLRFSTVDWEERSIEFLRKFLNELAYVTRKAFADESVANLTDDKSKKAFKVYAALFGIDESHVGGAQGMSVSPSTGSSTGSGGTSKRSGGGKPRSNALRLKNLGTQVKYWGLKSQGAPTYIDSTDPTCFRPTAGNARMGGMLERDSGEPNEKCSGQIRALFNKLTGTPRGPVVCGVKYCNGAMSAVLIKGYKEMREKDPQCKIEPGCCPVCWWFIQAKAAAGVNNPSLDMVDNSRLCATGRRIRATPAATGVATEASMVASSSIDSVNPATAGNDLLQLFATTPSPPVTNASQSVSWAMLANPNEQAKAIEAKQQELTAMMKHFTSSQAQTGVATAAPAPSLAVTSVEDLSRHELLQLYMKKASSHA
ncbi:hypothetical protein N9L31_00110, partial [bacterium]|nr:hypothetical protein [bacterium]